MIMWNEYMNGGREVSKLGFSTSTPEYIPQSYLDAKQFLIFRTCHSFGDWAIVSAIPKLLKQKYPDCTVFIPSPKCLEKYHSATQWTNKSTNPLNNVLEVFSANPYIDGMVDEIPEGLPIYHDHFRVYDSNDPNIPLVEQILKYWRFTEVECKDSQPDLYWTREEEEEGNRLIDKYIGHGDFVFFYLDDTFYIQDPNPLREPLELKRQVLQQYVDTSINLISSKCIYYCGGNLSDTPYRLPPGSIDIRSLNTTLRIQSYIKSKSAVIIGHQGGYGTDCMSRYVPCYVVPNAYDYIHEHIVRGTTYLNCYSDSKNIKLPLVES